MVRRVGIDATPLVAVKGGVGFYVDTLLCELLAQPGDAEFWLFAPIGKGDFAKYYAHSRVRIVVQPLLAFSEALWSQATLAYLCKKHEIDCFIGFTQSYPLLCAKRQRNILVIHDFTYILYPETMGYGRRIFLQVFSRYLIKYASAVVVNSAATGRRLCDRYRRHADLVVHPPIRELDSLTEGLTDEILGAAGCRAREYVVCVASFEPRKNLESMLGTIVELIEEGEDLFPLVLIGGNGWKKRKMVSLIDSLVVTYPDHFIKLNFVEEGRFSAILRNARLLVMPSLYEGYGMPIAEARSFGVPITATDLPEHREAAENDGAFFALGEMKYALKTALSRESKHEPIRQVTYSSADTLAKELWSLVNQ